MCRACGDAQNAHVLCVWAMQEDAAPAEEPQDAGAEEEEASEDEADMGDEEGDEEQHQRMLEDIRSAGRPVSSRWPKQVQTESVPESALNVGPMTDLPGMSSCPAAICTLEFLQLLGCHTAHKSSRITLW